jgi:hypothetical protein
MERALARGGGRTPSPFRVDLRVTLGNAREFDLWRSGMDPLFKLDAPDAEARTSFGANLTAFNSRTSLSFPVGRRPRRFNGHGR